MGYEILCFILNACGRFGVTCGLYFRSNRRGRSNPEDLVSNYVTGGLYSPQDKNMSQKNIYIIAQSNETFY
jgi:hypothetical protein